MGEALRIEQLETRLHGVHSEMVAYAYELSRLQERVNRMEAQGAETQARLEAQDAAIRGRMDAQDAALREQWWQQW